MLRLASLMRSAISRRKPMTLISVVGGPAAMPGAVFGRSPGAIAASRSLRTMRPPGPEPATVARSTPASCARRRFAGDVMTRPARAPGAGAAAGGNGAAGAGAAAGAAAVFAPSLNSNTMRGEPTATFSPGTPVTDTTLPLTGAGTSTAALSVITSTII